MTSPDFPHSWIFRKFFFSIATDIDTIITINDIMIIILLEYYDLKKRTE